MRRFCLTTFLGLCILGTAAAQQERIVYFNDPETHNLPEGYIYDVLPDRHISSEDFLQKYYEPLRAQYPEYIARDSIGVDDSGKYTMWRYTFTPENYTKTVWLQAGVHGRNEFESYYAGALMMRLIADAGKIRDPHLNYLRENVRFIVIPIVNVYDATEWTYRPNNASNINLNRDWYDQKSQEVRSLKALLAQYRKGEIDIAFDLHTDPEGNPGWGAYLLPYADNMPAEISDRMVAVNHFLYDRNIKGKVKWNGEDLLMAFMGPKSEYPSSSKEWRTNHAGNYKRGTAWKSISSGIWKDFGIPSATLEHGARKFGPQGSAVEMARAVELYLNQILAQVEDGPKLREDNIDEVLAAMTLEEKAELLVGGGKEFRVRGLPAGRTRAIARLGIPATYLADGPAGVKVNYPRTGFPTGTLLASSWDTALLREVATAMGKEAHENGIDVILAPGMNIHRNPLCGRNFEYFSEDPLLTGKLAAAYVEGVQSQGVGATVKHFAVNNQETLRTTLDARVGQRPLREIYLKGFEIAVKEAAPWAVMASYNQLNGEYTQQKKSLLTGILREEWGFDGFVMTDWGKKAGTVKAVQAGNDLMEPGFEVETTRIVEAVRDGSLDIADVDRNVRNMLRYIVKTPAFKQYPCSHKPDISGHAALSRRAAATSTVLLKNDDGTLPLLAGLRLALHPLSGMDFVTGGTGSGSIGKGGATLQTALEKAGFAVEEDGSAEGNDLAVAVISRKAGEEKDRKVADDFNLSATEQYRLASLCADFHRAGKKVVVILNVCGVVETASWKNLPDAILLPWAPGKEGVHAVADVLLGKVNPSGKLPMTFPVRYEDEPSAANFPADSASIKKYTDYAEGIFVGYRHYTTFDKKVSYPFGYGLSYTTFAYSKPGVKTTPDGFEARITVKNTGKVPGRESVQLYVSAPDGGLEKPACELKAFAKTRLLAPGERETLSFKVSLYDLASFNGTSTCWETASGEYTLHFGASVEDIRATRTWRLKEPSAWLVKVRPAYHY